jgi:hypothetical protein
VDIGMVLWIVEGEGDIGYKKDGHHRISAKY